MLAHTRYILLADDDTDDSALFCEILEELPFPTQVTVLHNGEQLMQFLFEKTGSLPDVLFLDLNMPRKNGFECLKSIKGDDKLKNIPVIIFTTSNEPSVINLLYKSGAHYYIRKPSNFEQLQKVIQLALTLTDPKNISQPSREEFVISAQPVKDEK